MMTFDPKTNAEQSVVLGSYDHLDKCRAWIERARGKICINARVDDLSQAIKLRVGGLCHHR